VSLCRIMRNEVGARVESPGMTAFMTATGSPNGVEKEP
jgi:hypothetical protein